MKRIRVDLRLAAAGFLALVAGLAVHALTRPAPAIEAVVAAAPLPPGVPLAALPLTTAAMTPQPGLIAAADFEAWRDHRLMVALDSGNPLLVPILGAPSGSGHDMLGLTLGPEHAVHGALAPGDRVDVYTTTEEGTTLLASGVLILDAVTGTGGLGGNDIALLLAVDRDLALALVTASHRGRIDLVRLHR